MGEGSLKPHTTFTPPAPQIVFILSIRFSRDLQSNKAKNKCLASRNVLVKEPHKDETVPLVTTGPGLEGITLSEISQAEDRTIHRSYIECNTKK